MSEQICLVVDDEPVIRSLVRSFLKCRQFQIVGADNADEALGLVQRLGGRLDCLVSDINMPQGA